MDNVTAHPYLGTNIITPCTFRGDWNGNGYHETYFFSCIMFLFGWYSLWSIILTYYVTFPYVMIVVAMMVDRDLYILKC